MNRIFTILLFLLITCNYSFSQNKKAFIVGISNYDTNASAYQWNNIHGADDAYLLIPELQKQGFSITQVLDQEATYKGITSKLTTFINKLKKGDMVYLHLSGHGQPIEDTDGDESDGWDEAFIPVDAYKYYKKGVYEGESHLIDDKIAYFTNTIRKKVGVNGIVYVVIDACHAGTSSRGEEYIRGTRIGFSKNGKSYSPPMSKTNTYKLIASNKLSNIVFIEACRSDQFNKEIKIGGKYYGPLSYSIYKTISHYLFSTSTEKFIKELKSTISKGGFWPNNQNLVIESSK